MFTLQEVLIDALWILGLAGLLATFSYMDWYRGIRGWKWGDMLRIPRTLFPFYLSLTILGIGLALNGLTASQLAPWWETVAWVLLSLFCFMHAIIYSVAGRQRGWDTPTEGKSDERRQTDESVGITRR
jgi:hypothetical protein